MSTVLTQGIRPVEFIMSEAAWHRSRDAIAIKENQEFVPGTLLVAEAIPAATTQAQSRSGAGNGVLTFANPAVSSSVKGGRYIVTFTGAGATAPFQVQDPSGAVIGNGAVGSAFDKDLKFTVADGAADFAVGDQIFLDIGVEPTDQVFSAWDPSQSGQKIAAIALYGAVTGAGETKKIAGLVREAEVNGHCLNLPVGVTAAQTAKAYADLRDLQIIVRN